jgi:hypothetical protein
MGPHDDASRPDAISGAIRPVVQSVRSAIRELGELPLQSRIDLGGLPAVRFRASRDEVSDSVTGTAATKGARE